ncbi:unnamed protein product [Ectocarpus sp. 12 AP-2014]
MPSMPRSTETLSLDCFKGGAMAVTGDGSVTFEKPEVVRISDNTLLANEYNPDPITGCSLAYVEGNETTIVGFDFDDICQEVTV